MLSYILQEQVQDYKHTNAMQQVCPVSTGSSVGTDQSVFAITDDLFFAPYFGTAWALNGTQYITFDESLGGVKARNPYTQSVQTLQHVGPEFQFSALSGYGYATLNYHPVTANQTDGTSNGTVYLTVATN